MDSIFFVLLLLSNFSRELFNCVSMNRKKQQQDEKKKETQMRGRRSYVLVRIIFRFKLRKRRAFNFRIHKHVACKLRCDGNPSVPLLPPEEKKYGSRQCGG